MGLKALREKYIQIAKAAKEERLKSAEVIGNDSVELITNRLESGIDSDGNKFPLYSKKPMPYWKINENETNRPSAVKKFKKDAQDKKIIPSYEVFRTYFGLPVDRRTHIFSGEMMASIQYEIIQHDNEKTIIEIKSNDRENQDKVNHNSGIVKKNILRLSQPERELIEIANSERVARLISEIKST